MESPDLSYRYTVIDAKTEIRILVLLPSPCFSSPLRTNLIHTRMVHDVKTHNEIKTPKYEAVSYCWGNLLPSLQLECDGRALMITANVDIFLRHLRKKDRPRWLWVDAICINQEDDVDKAQQVLRMDVIFGRAKKVHVWLGDEKADEDISLTFEYLHNVASVLNVRSENKKKKRILSMEQATMVARLFSRPWFCRRWILQEVAVAQNITVHCDSFKIDWKSFMAFPNAVQSSTISNSGTELQLSKHVLDAIQIPVLLEQRQYEIFGLLSRCHLHECKDERDRLFSLYGIASMYSNKSKSMVSVKDFFPVTYEQPWVDVYISFASNSVRIGNGHKILEHVFEFGSLYHQNSKWPSWVPSWNFKRRLKCPFFTKQAIEWNSRGWSVRSVSGNLSITINGHASAKLRMVSWPTFPVGDSRHLYIEHFRKYFTPLGFLAHYKSIIRDLCKLTSYYGYHDLSASTSSEATCCPNSNDTCVANHLLKHLKPFRTQCLGYDVVGLGPGSIRPEDLVVSAAPWPIYGPTTPASYLDPESFAFIVRPAPDIPTEEVDRGCVFRLVSWCYVYNDSKACSDRAPGAPRSVILV